MFTTTRFLAVAAALATGAQQVWAQEATASTLEIEGVTANFEPNVQDLHLESQIIPNLLSSLQAQALLNVAYSGNMISLGQALDQSAVQTQPNMTVSPESNATSTFGSDATFTVALVDADVVGTDDVANNVTRHWLVNNVKLSGGEAPYALDYTTAAITNYAGPGPASGSGAHRYCLFLISQPSSFTAPEYLSQPDTPLSTYNFTSYLTETGLGGIVAASYFTVENGQATAQVSSTSAVQSSTLAAASMSSTSSSSSSSMMSSGMSSTKASSTSGSMSASASATSQSSGAIAAIKSTSTAIVLLGSALAAVVAGGAYVL